MKLGGRKNIPLFFQGHQAATSAPALAPRPPARPTGMADNQRAQQQQADPRNGGSNGCRHTQQQQPLNSSSPLKVSMNPNAPPAESDSAEEEEEGMVGQQKQQQQNQGQQQQRYRHQQHQSEMRPYIKPPFHRHISDQAHRPPPSALIQVGQSHQLETKENERFENVPKDLDSNFKIKRIARLRKYYPGYKYQNKT